MPDRFSAHATGLEAPAQHGFAVTPDDITDLIETTRALFIGGRGTLAVTMASGATVSFQGVQAGSLLAIRVQRVHATGTSASQIVGMV